MGSHYVIIKLTGWQKWEQRIRLLIKNNYREYSCTNAYQYEQSRTSRIYQQTAYVKLAYTFDFGKKTSREFNSVDRSINSAILKAE